MERQFVTCAYSGCTKRAVIKRNKTNICVGHYDEENLIEALKWNDAHDLKTDEQRQDYIFNTPFKFKNITPQKEKAADGEPDTETKGSSFGDDKKSDPVVGSPVGNENQNEAAQAN